MSGRRPAEAQLHLAALERLERIIAAFASMVSHQTRTALVGIQGWSELIRDGELSTDEVRAYAGDIFTEALKIDSMIGEMLDLNSLETGQSALRRIRVDVRDIVAESAARFELNPVWCGDPRPIMGDRDRLGQAFQKVFGFVARTAQPNSQITVTATCDAESVAVSVRSSSSRVVEFEDWLLGRYERYEQRPSAVLGAGLGLAIARAIVELHEGTIEARTPAPGGAEFLVRLPVPAASAAARAREREQKASP